MRRRRDDRELGPTLDELLGSFEWIDQDEAIDGTRARAALLGHHRKARQVARKAAANDLVGGQVGRRHRRAVGLVVEAAGLPANLHDDLAGTHGNDAEEPPELVELVQFKLLAHGAAVRLRPEAAVWPNPSRPAV
jgi:hypothetical protein